MKTSYSTLYKSLWHISFNAINNIKPIVAILSSSLACTSVLAATSNMENEADYPTADFPAITVTATRTPTAINNTIAQAHVIDSEALKHYQGQTVLDVIKRQPGFSSFTNGGMGTTDNFYLRGYNKNSILVLIDGVRYSAISGGGANLGLLPADQIERIEVLYGASGSSLYGSDAMGGVIQIFTKGSNVNQNNFSVTAGVGSHDHYLYGATAQFNNAQGTSLSLSASHNETDGFNSLKPESGNYNKDEDGFESDNYSLHIQQKLNDAITVGTSGLYSESTTDFDAYGDWITGAAALDNAHADQKNGAANAYIQYATTNQTAKLSYGYSIDDTKSYENVSQLNNPSQYKTKQQQVNLIGSYTLPVGTAIYGAEHLTQELDSNVYTADDRKVTSGFIGYNISQSNFDAQANVRYDDYSDYDSETTYNLGAAYRFTPELRIGANYAKGYRVPTFNDLYYPGSGNPNLKPETSDNYEAFIEYDTPLQSTRLTGYHNKVDDILTFKANYDAQGNYLGGMVKNISKAKIEGITVTSDWSINNYLFGLSYDYQKAKDNSGESYDGNFLPIRPEHKGLAYVGYQLADLDVRAEYQYVGDYYYSIDNTKSQKVDSYNLVNISGNYQLSPNLSMTARLNNVFNKEYITAPGYNTDGTNFMTSLTYNWK